MSRAESVVQGGVVQSLPAGPDKRTRRELSRFNALKLLVIGILSPNGQLLLCALDGGAGNMARAVGQAAQLNLQIHRVGRIIQIRSNRNAADLFPVSVKDDGHRVIVLDIIPDYQLHLIRSGRNGYVSFSKSILDGVFIGWNIALYQRLHTLSVFLVLFLLSFDDPLSQPAATTATSFGLIFTGRVQRCSLRLPIGAHLYLEMLYFSLFSFEA